MSPRVVSANRSLQDSRPEVAEPLYAISVSCLKKKGSGAETIYWRNRDMDSGQKWTEKRKTSSAVFNIGLKSTIDANVEKRMSLTRKKIAPIQKTM